MSKLIELSDLDRMAGLWVEPNDPALCECGKPVCKDPCPLMPEPPDERCPDAQTRWHLGY